jgi:hypothetical protein
MMVIPVKIAAASTLSAVPMVYSLRTAKELRAEISILSTEQVVDAFVAGAVDNVVFVRLDIVNLAKHFGFAILAGNAGNRAEARGHKRSPILH